MKVEYPVQLFQSFNKRIWNNKPFTYFVIALIICYTVMLRNYPEIYYKYLLDPIILSFVIICCIIITVYNFQLGLVLIISLISLYYPKQYKNEYIEEKVENFEGTTSPIEKTDKNIIDDEKKKKPKSSTKSTPPPEEDSEVEEPSEDEEEQTEQESDSEEDNKISGIKLENLNPNYYIKSKSENDGKKVTTKKKSNNKRENSSSSASIVEKLTDVKKPKDASSSFLGEVRSIISDLDTGKNRMNASNAIKQINSLMQQKHRSDIQKIINKEDEEEEEDDSDEDFY
jgi:hypothetical protein